MTTSEPSVRVFLFGYPIAQRSGGEELALESAKVRALLAYLSLHLDLPQSRDFLAYLLWPDVPNETARKNLRQALYSLRKALGDLADACLDIQRHSLTLRSHPKLWVDAKAFEHTTSQITQHQHRPYGSCPYCAVRYRDLLKLYRGEFLQGFSVRGSPPFEEWLTEQREYFRRRALEGIHLLVRYHYLRGEFDQAEQLTRQWLRWEPWNDVAYGYLIRSLALQGQKNAARQAFLDFKRMMQEELGADVPAEAKSLMYDIQHGLLLPPHSLRLRERLPHPHFPLYGREEEREHLLKLLADPNTRLVTLTGPGGIGKSRLAQEVAHAALPLFPDGVYWVRLAEVHTEHDFLLALRDALGLSGDTAGLRQRLFHRLEDKHALFILDDIDGLQEPLAQLVHALLQRSRHVAFLATARHPLHLRLEHRLPLSGLAYPAEGTEPTPEEAQTYPAIQLLIRWARQIGTKFRLTAANLPSVLRIVRFTQGHPLALELAAVQVAYRSAEAVARSLEEAVLDLEAPYRDQNPQHRSLRILLEQSWQALTPELQEALLYLAGFDGPFDEDLAQAIAQTSLDTLQALTRRSLLHPLEAPHAQRVWEIHPLTRVFLREKAAERPHIEATFRQRAREWLRQALAAPAITPMAEQGKVLRQMASLQHELDQFLTELQQQAPADMLDPLIYGLSQWFRYHGLTEEAGQYFAALEARLRPLAAQDPRSQKVLARVLHRRALFAYFRGEIAQAHALAAEAVELLQPKAATDHDILLDLGRALQTLSAALEFEGDLDASRQAEEEALAVFKRHLAHQPHPTPDALSDVGNAYNNLGGFLYKEGQMEQAIPYYEQAIAFYRQAGALHMLANTLGNLGMAYLSLNRFDEAQQACEESLRAAQAVGAQYPLIYALINMASIAMEKGDPETAYFRLQRAIRLAQRAQMAELLVQAWGSLGLVLGALNKADEARKYFLQSIEKAQQHGLHYLEVVNRVLFARFLLQGEAFTEARAMLRQALQDAVTYHFDELFHWGLILLGAYLHLTKQLVWAHALVLWLEAQDLTPQNQERLKTLRRTLGTPSARVRQQAAQRAEQATAETWLSLL